jgi:hypothetical protein
MTVYPNAIDGDAELIRVDDAITEIGAEAINQLREAVFAIQQELGIRPSGTVGSLADRLSVFLNDNGTIKTSAFASVGLVTLPITDNQVGTNAGISEFKLNLDHSTSDLYNLTISNQSLINSVVTFTNTLSSDLNTHIAGGQLLADGDPARHVASHIDLNAVPSDSRDLAFTWTGLLDTAGNARTATTVAEGLLQINDELVAHQNTVVNAHPGTAIDLNVDNFTEIPQTVDTVQKLADHIDDFEVLTIGEHRAVQHANAIPLIARSDAAITTDGYSQNVVPSTPVNTYLVTSPNITPVDDLSTGDDIINFVPDNTNFLFDGQFSQVSVGDIVTVNYGNGVEASFPVESIRYVPGTRWIIRINGTNLADNPGDGYALARIDRPKFDRNTAGVLAVAAANATPIGSFNTQLSSLIVGNPRGATAVGIGFDPNQLDATHYNLYLEMYPTGNPADRVISLPAIDVTGNQGATPGSYTLDSVIQETNNSLREIGFNLRFIAFAYEGNFGIMLADAINNVGFSIVNGALVGGTLVVGSFINNVIGEANGDDRDALGFGATHAALASPNYSSTTSFPDSTAAQNPTKVFVPFKRRNYVVDGRNVDSFAATWNATEDSNGDYYWDGYISARTPVGSFTVETTYTINLDLKAAGLRPGKTIIVQPTVAFDDSSYFDVDYGRFIIKSISFPPECPGETAQTTITVINGIHADGNGFAFSSSPDLAVKIYFGEDSVGFNNENVINTTPTALDYHRLHEVFISNQLNTFSHERARMPVQNETGTLLASTNWHIENVSPKLGGYKDTTLSQNRFIRLFILSYDTDTGQYDGYIGKRSGSGIISLGPVTTGRKDVVTRFYDETNVDFIDLRYIETGVDSGSATSILSDGTSGGGGTPRYVDIELFPSLRNNDEMFLLATCEVNWDPPAGQAIVERVIDRREFGSVDEEDFTQSAIDFIRAGDRFLHDNGVLRGLEFDFISVTDTAELFFKGGVALVNGNIVSVNNISATIPQITENPTTSDTLDWAICVDEFGNLVPVLLVATEQQFFARDLVSPNNTYYVPTYTFQELIEERKDLTPIYIANVTIASVTVNSTSDVRRFVDDGKGRELVFSPQEFAGTFNTVIALKNWVNNYASDAPLHAKVRGTFELTSSMDFTGFEYPVVLDGDGATFNITADRGLLIEKNTSFKRFVFNYADGGGLTFDTNDIINYNNGCVYAGSTVDVTNVSFEDCSFNSSAAVQRPPFISLVREKGDLVDGFNVSRCKFNDSNVAAENMAAISILTTNALVGTEPALITNSRIENNVCNKLQGIYITQESGGSPDYRVSSPGIVALNTIISGNNCGVIGFNTSNVDSTNSSFTDIDRSESLIIENNTCILIGNIVNIPTGNAIDGTVLGTSSAYLSFTSGGFIIKENKCSTIFCVNTNDDESAGLVSSKIIKGNSLSAPNYLTLEKFTNINLTGTFLNAVPGIYVGHGSLDIGDVQIIDNSLKVGRFDSTSYYYNQAIRSSISSTIKGNVVRGINTNGFGIRAVRNLLISGFRQFVITDNRIYRDGRSISRYLDLDSNDSESGGIVKNNFLDSTTIDGADEVTITARGSRSVNFTVSNNKNHIETVSIPVTCGVTGVEGGLDNLGTQTLNPTVTERASLFVSGSNTYRSFNYVTTGVNREFAWAVPLLDCLPPDVLITEIEISYTLDVVPTTGELRLSLHNDTTSETDAAAPVAVGIGTATTNWIPTGDFYNNNGLMLWIRTGINDASSASFSYITLNISYQN